MTSEELSDQTAELLIYKYGDIFESIDSHQMRVVFKLAEVIKKIRIKNTNNLSENVLANPSATSMAAMALHCEPN
jgi:hypothetical protein